MTRTVLETRVGLSSFFFFRKKFKTTSRKLETVYFSVLHFWDCCCAFIFVQLSAATANPRPERLNLAVYGGGAVCPTSLGDKPSSGRNLRCGRSVHRLRRVMDEAEEEQQRRRLKLEEALEIQSLRRIISAYLK